VFTAPHEDRAAAHLCGAPNNLQRYNRAARAGRDRCVPHCVRNKCPPSSCPPRRDMSPSDDLYNAFHPSGILSWSTHGTEHIRRPPAPGTAPLSSGSFRESSVLHALTLIRSRVRKLRPTSRWRRCEPDVLGSLPRPLAVVLSPHLQGICSCQTRNEPPKLLRT
jgi:hypothetical protein